MANLYFPQLASGAVAQYPIAKTRSQRSIRNILPDGRLIVAPDAGPLRTLWTLSYTQLSTSDLDAFQAFFVACSGAFRSFTFLDPTENLLASATDLSRVPWQPNPMLTLTSGAADPNGGQNAWSLQNSGQTNASLSQTLQVPAWYQYCLSALVRSDQAVNLQMTRSAGSQQTTDVFPLTSGWTPVRSSGRLNDRGEEVTFTLTVPPGNTVQVYGLQVEPQIERTEALFNTPQGGIYTAHWAQQEFIVEASGPDSFATILNIEATR